MFAWKDKIELEKEMERRKVTNKNLYEDIKEEEKRTQDVSGA